MYELARQGGLKCLLSEAMPSLAASASIFANAPVGTILILVDIRAFPLTMTFEGTTATAGVVGHDYGTTTGQQPKEFFLNQKAALQCRAIQNGGATTGRISYFGLNT